MNKIRARWSKFYQRYKDLNGRLKAFYDRFRRVPRRYPLVLSGKEQAFFKKNIANVNTYLEFGAGGSTFICLINTKASRIVSVESDSNWVNYLRKWRIIRKAEKKRLKFFSVSIGKVGKWGRPTEEDKKELFPDYSKNVFEEYKDNDLIFIDGRFRVACAIQAALNSSQNTKIMMHDYVNREHYHIIEQFLEVEETVDTMALFRIKDGVNKDDLLKLYEEYKYNCD